MLKQFLLGCSICCALIFFLFSAFESNAQCTPCGATVHTVDLSANPDTAWTIPKDRRGDTCCGNAGKCVRFDVTLHPLADELSWDITDGPNPGGQQFQVDCGAYVNAGAPFCITGSGNSYCIVYCKPGNDQTGYTITSSRNIAASPDITIQDNCTGILTVDGVNQNSITWSSISPGAVGDYDSYLSCTDSCDTTYVNPLAGYPDSVQFLVSANPLSQCNTNTLYDTVTVHIVGGMAVAISPLDPAVCFGDATAELTASATGGAPPFTYTWEDSTGVLATGTDSTFDSGVRTIWVGVTDTSAGCPAVYDTVAVRQFDAGITAFAGTDTTICEGQSFVLEGAVTVVNTAIWSNYGGTISDSTDTTATYTPSAAEIAAGFAELILTTTNNGGCAPGVDTVRITIQGTPVAPTVGSNSSVCEGDDLNLTASNITGATYTWSGPNSFSSSVQNPTRSGTVVADDGFYSVFATVAGCPGPSDSVDVTITPIPVAPTAGSNSPLCEGDDLNLTASNIATATYAWTGPNTFTSAVQNPTRSSVVPADAGTYSVIATVNGCPGPAGTVAVAVTGTPAAPTAGSNSPLCEGDDLNLTASNIATATYAWTGPNTFTSAVQNPTRSTVVPADAGTYSVIASVNGCPGPAGTVAVAVTGTPAAPTAGSNTPLCEGDDLNLTASNIATATYAWTGPNTFTSAVQNPTRSTVVPADAGSYSVIASVNGCPGPAGTVAVAVTGTPAAPTAGSNTPLCEGDDLNLTASNIATATYAWTGPNTFTSAVQNPTRSTVVPADAGTYSVIASVNGCPGPAGTVAVAVTGTPAAPTAGSNTPLCEGDDLNLTASNIATATYAWTGPNTFTSAVQNPTRSTVVPADAGTYSVIASVNGCPGPAGTVAVAVTGTPAAPTAGSNTPLCEGDDLNLTASNIATATYAWTGPNTFTSAVQNPTRSSVVPADAGTYSVIASVNGCPGPAGTVAVAVTGTPAAPTAGSNSPLCEGDDLNLTASNIATATYAWTGPNTFTSAVQNPTRSSVVPADAGTYSVIASVNGCPGPAGTVAVAVTGTPAAPTAGSNTPLCEGDDLNLTASNIATATYAWTGPNTFTSAVQNPTRSSVVPADAGTYSVIASVNGCPGPAGTVAVAVTGTPAAPTAGSNTPLCEGDDLNLTASNIATATYAWTGPNTFTSAVQNPTRSSVVPADAGTYSVIASVNGCPGPAGTVAVAVTGTPAAPTAGSNTPLCEGDDLNLTASNIATATYAWTGPNTFTSAVQNPTRSSVVPADAGTYSVIASVNGCPGPAGTVAVAVTGTPAAPTAGSNTPLCEGDDLNLTASNIATATYAWTGPNTFTSAVQNPTRSSVVPADAGTYSVIASVNGCPGPAGTVAVAVTGTPAAPTAGSNTPLCEGDDLNLTASNIATATYAWTGPNTFTSAVQNPTRSSVVPADAGTYSVIASVNGCPGPAGTVAVAVTGTPAAPTAGSNTPLCEGDDLNLTASNIATATYAWTGPNTFTSAVQNPTRSSVVPADAGTYSVIATVNGCPGPAGTVAVAVTGTPAAPTAGSNTPLCEGDDLNLTASNIATATYAWTGPSTFTSALQNPTRSTVVPADAGTYSVIASVNGCPGPAGTVAVAVTGTPAAPTAGSNSPLCEGDDLNLTASNIATATYAWTGPNTFTSAVQNPTRSSVVPADAGTYSVIASVNGCPGPAGTVAVAVTGTPAAPTAGSNTPLCEGDDLNLTASNIATATYAWTGPNTFTSAVQNPTRSSVVPADAGTYSVIASVNGCPGPAGTVAVAVTGTPAAPTAGSNSPLCEGDDLNLTASNIATATYAWTGPNTFTSAVQNPTRSTVVPADAGTYSVIASVNGCPGPAGTVAVAVTGTPAAPTAGSNTPLCEGDDLNLTASNIATATYAWTGPNTFTSTVQNPTRSSVVPADAGTYSVIASVNGCPGPAGTVAVAVTGTPAAPTAGSNTPLCEGDDLNLTASNIATATYAWTGPNTFTSAVQNPTRSNVVPADAGTYSVIASVNGCPGPAGTVAVAVTGTPAAPSAGSNTPLCEGDDLNLTASNIATATYAWTGPNTFSSAVQNPTRSTVVPADAGTYSVIASVNGCPGPAGTVAVAVTGTPAAPTAGSNTPLCEGDNLNLTASNIATATYAWTGPNTFSSAVQNPTRSTVVPADAGTYSVIASVNGCPGPAGTVAVAVTGTPAAPSAGSNTPLCEGDDLNLTASNIATATYAWTGPNTFSSAVQNPTRSSVVPADAGTYSVIASVNGCPGPAGTVAVAVTGTPAAPTAGSNTPLCEGDDLNLTASNIATATYAWTGPNTFTSAVQNPTRSSVVPADAGTYSVIATVNGCPGPAGTVAVTVTGTPAAPTASSNSPLCEGDDLNLTASNIATATYAWTGPNTFSSAVQNPTRSSVVPADAGTYSVIASVNGCPGPAGTVAVAVTGTPAAPTAGSNTPLCEGDDLNLTASNIATATYAWTGPNTFTSAVQNPTRSTVVPADAGTYSVIASVNGCPGPAGTVAVAVTGTPAAPTAGSNTPLCEGDDLNLTASNIATATYAWTGPNTFTSAVQNPTRSTVVPADAGTYSVIASVNGCPGPVGTVAVTVTGTPAAPTAGSNTPLCEGDDLNLTASNIATATYAWTGPNTFSSAVQNPTRSSVVPADAGTYSVIASVNGCPGPAGTVAVAVTGTPATPTAGSNTPLCEGDDLNLTASNIATATYAWTGPNTFTSAVQNPTRSTVVPADAGTYSVIASVNGCPGPAGTVAVAVTGTPAAPTAGSNTPLCEGDDLNLTASNIATATYAWSGPNSFAAAVQNPTINSVIPANAGTYNVIASVNNCPGPAGSVAVSITPTPSTPTVSSNGPLCEGDNLNLTASTVIGSTYTWAGPNTFTSTSQNPNRLSVVPADSGWYSVYTTEAGCNGIADSVFVAVTPTPVVSTLGSNSPLCNGDDLNLTASSIAGATYAWTGPNSFTSTSQNPTRSAVTLADSGQYNLIASVNSCPGPSANINVTIFPIPTTPTASSNSPICEFSDLNLSASNVAGATYSWTGPNGFTDTIQNPTISSALVVASGTYNVTSTVNGCTSPAGSTSVTVNPAANQPTAGSNSPLCEGDNLNLTASTIAGVSYSWSGPNSYSASTQNPTLSAVALADSGYYYVFATLAGCPGQSDSVFVTVNPIPSPPVAASNSPICENDDLLLTASNITGASYSWTGPSSFTSSVQNPTISSAQLANGGAYNVVATVNGCGSSSALTNVTVNPIPTSPTLSNNTPICSGTTLNLSSTATAGATYSWTGPNGYSASTQNASLFPALDSDSGYFSCAITVSGCTSPSDSTLAVIHSIPSAPAASSNTPVCEGSTLNLSAANMTGATYSWAGPNAFTSFSQNPSIASTVLASDGDYTVTATVNGCTGPSDTTNVTIIPLPAAPVVGSNSPVCETLELNLTASTIIGGTYTWSGPNAFSDTSQNPSVTNFATVNTGSYSVRAEVNGCLGPAGTTSVTMTDKPADPIISSNSPVCLDDDLNLTAGNVTGGTFTWSGPATFTASTQNPTRSSITASDTGTYYASVTVSGCSSDSIGTTVALQLPPTADAGIDQIVCSDTAGVDVSGTITGATSAIWSSSGSGTFSPDSIGLSTTYLPSAVDTANGSVQLFMTTTGNGNCVSTTDTVLITLTPAPTLDIGTDKTVCASNAVTSLNASTTIATSVDWLSSGSGSFSPSASGLNISYTPSSADTTAGTVTIFATTTGSGQCKEVNDTMVITITNALEVDAGNDVIICAQTPQTSISGTVPSTGLWSSNGTGSFTPTDSAMNATYNASPADTVAGSVEIYLESTNNGTCLTAYDTLILTVNPGIYVNAGNDQTLCSNNSFTSLNGSVTFATGGTWTTSGSGAFEDEDSLITNYTPSAADTSSGNVTLILTSTGNGGCAAVRDTMSIILTPGPQVDAGLDETVCNNNSAVTLNGAVFGANSTGQWTTNGSGTFAPNDSTLNATYTPSSTDTTNGGVTLYLSATNIGTCLAADDSIEVTIIDEAKVNAGSDQIICKNNAVAALSGSVSVLTTTGTWTTLGGGSFSPNANDLNASYFPDAADTAAGNVTIILQSTVNSVCLPERDTLIITINDAPLADAGMDLVVCADTAGAPISGTVTNAGGGLWSTSGSGVFSPNDSSLTGNYHPDSLDIANGSVTLTLTTTGIGNCIAVSNNMLLSITPEPVVDAGSDLNLCANIPSISILGSISGGASAGIWTTSGTGSFSPNDSSLSIDYFTSSADTVAGQVEFVLSTSDHGQCKQVRDTVILNIGQAPQVDAGTDQSFCANLKASLNGNLITGNGAQWTTLGSGTFTPFDTTLNATYSPSAADTASAGVTLILSSINNAGCFAARDTMQITLTPGPQVDAGSNIAVCENNDIATITGQVTGTSTTGQWFTSGSGSFTPNDSSLTVDYVPGNTDTAGTTLTLRLEATNIGGCLPVSDSITYTINLPPVVDAGVDQITCFDNDIILNGSAYGATSSARWSTTGGGSFTPNVDSLNAVYTPIAADTVGVILEMILTSTNNGGCIADTDTMNIVFTDFPTVIAGPDTSLCANNLTLSLNGIVSGSSTTGLWTTSGSGTFSPSDTTLNATYIPSSADSASASTTITLTATNTCPIQDSFTINYTPAPTVNAGVDQFICEGDLDAVLNATISGGATQGEWTSNGTGGFAPSNTDLAATYTMSTADTTIGSVVLTLETTDHGNCLAVSDSVKIEVTPVPVVSAGLDQSICANVDPSLSGTVSTGPQQGEWETLGSGTFSNDTSLNTTYAFSTADTTAGGVSLTLTSTFGCRDITDTVIITITPGPQVNAGISSIICSNNAQINVIGDVFGNTTDGRWTSSGSGTFTPNDSSLSVSYSADSTDISNGSFTLYLTSINNGGCTPETDSTTITISPAPIPDAGLDKGVCVDQGSQVLSGAVSDGTTPTYWTTLGSGSFAPDSSDLNASYTFSPADTTAGTVELALSTVAGNGCLAEHDTMTLTIVTDALAIASNDFSVCEDLDSISISGVVNGTNTGQWTSLSGGSFSPSDTSLIASFVPDLSSGNTITLTLETTNTGTCAPDKDTLIITRDLLHAVNPGIDQDVCEGISTVNLNGAISGGATSATWSTNGSGSFTPNDSTLNADYVFSNADTTAGAVYLILNTNTSNACATISDSIEIRITDSPGVSAGADFSACANTITSVTGSVSGPTGITEWSTLGSGSFDSIDSLTSDYLFSNADTTAGQVDLILTNTVSCGAFSDTVTITITPAPQVDAGTNSSVCRNNPDYDLSGRVFGGATTGSWTTSGSGDFTPNDSTLLGTYEPSASDLAGSDVTLTLTATNFGSCNSVQDAITLVFTDGPIADAGVDFTACITSASTSVNGTISDSLTQGFWTTLGAGSFAPTDSALSTNYLFDAADTTAGSVELVLTTTPPAGCIATVDTVLISFVNTTSADAGLDQAVCANADSIALNGSVSGTSTGEWSTLSTGTFSPSSTDLNALFIPESPNADTIQLVLRTTNTGGCPTHRDTLELILEAAPVVDGGNNIFLCGGATTANLSGSIVQGASTIQWSTTGTGAITPSDADLNISYDMSDVDTANGSVFLILATLDHNPGCQAGVDSVFVSYDASSTLELGPPTSACANTDLEILPTSNGTPLSNTWSTTGSGVFNSDTTFNTIYSFSTADTTSGSVQLILTSVFDCNVLTDTLDVTITPAPQVDAGTNSSVCRNNPDYDLSGRVFGGATTGSWTTSGSGDFSPNDSTLLGTYEPSASDLAGSGVTLTLTATNFGSCNSVQDAITLVFTDGPIADAGVDFTACITSASTSVNGTISDSLTQGFWTTLGAGSFAPTDSALSTNYLFDAADTTAGSVELVLTTIPPAGCIATADTVLISFVNTTSANAGIDLMACANSDSIALNGIVTGTTTGAWSTLSTGSFTPSASDLNTFFVADSPNADTIQLVLRTTNTGGCPTDRDTVELILDAAPIVDGGNDIFLCGGTTSTNLSGSIVRGASNIEWSTTGTGVISPSQSDFNITYDMSDADTTNGSVFLILSTLDHNSGCQAGIDSVFVSYNASPSLELGTPTFACANTSLEILPTSNATPLSNSWSTTGSGSFGSDTSFNSTYSFSNTDTTNGSVQLILTSVYECNVLSDTLDVTITPAPQVDAGLDQTICRNNPDVTLAAVISSGATAGIWFTNGTGSFVPNDSSLNSTYQPSADDLILDSLSISLRTTDHGTCNPVEDSILVFFTNGPIADAGVDFSVCKINGSTEVEGTITDGLTTGYWNTLGDGTFSPTDSALSVDYNFGVSDTTSGNVDLIFTTIPPTGCLSTSDTMTLLFIDLPSADAGSDLQLCADNDSIAISGTVIGTNTGLWTILDGDITIPNDSTLSTHVFPSSLIGDTALVMLQTTKTGKCPTGRDTMQIILDPAPIVNAGNNIFLCGGSLIAPLEASITGGATNGNWSTLGNGTFSPNDSSLTPDYTMSAADTTAGQVNLILTSTNHNANCQAGRDTVLISFNNSPILDAGIDQSVCANNKVDLEASVNDSAYSVLWTSSGSGSFIPDTSLITKYAFTAADTTVGAVELYVVTTHNCDTLYDTLQITITPAPYVDAGIDYTQCKNAGDIDLTGNVFGATTTGIWSSTTGGTYSPSNSDLNTSYSPTQEDLDSGIVVHYLSSTNDGTCRTAIDSVVITLIDGPIADAGPDRSVCINSTSVRMTASVGDTVTSGFWSTLGTGNYIPDSIGLSTFYVPSTDDTTQGNVDLVFTTIPAPGCLVTTDTIGLTFIYKMIVNLEPTMEVCVGLDSIPMEAELIGTTNGLWTKFTTGIFTPSFNSLAVHYLPDSSDYDQDSLLFFFQSNSGFGCEEDLDTLVVYIKDLPEFNAGDDQTICRDSLNVQLDGQVTPASTNFIWTHLGSGIFNSDTNLSPIYSMSTQDSLDERVTLILQDSNALCSAANDTLVLNLTNPTPVLTPFDTVLCEALSYDLVGITNENSQVNWYTLGDGTFSTTTEDSTTYSPGPVDFDSAQVTLVLELATNCGALYDTTNYQFNPRPVTGFETFNECDTFGVSFIDTSSIRTGSIASIRWDLGDSTTNSNLEFTHYYSNYDSVEVRLTVTSDLGCKKSASRIIVPWDTLHVQFSPNNVTVDIEETITFVDSTKKAESYLWNTGDGFGTSFEQSFDYTYSDTGSYQVSLSVVDTNGCADSSVTTIVITKDFGIGEYGVIAIPSAFTPNADGANDILLVRGGPFSSFSFTVFNEWGNQLFQSNTPSNGWDGTYRGKEQAPGIYFYLMRGITLEGEEVEMSGEVSLMR